MIIPPLTEIEINEKKVNDSKGEFLVLKKLENIASERGWIVYRSFRLENHPNKIEGEIDVVIFTQTQGIILLEVKSSRLKVSDKGEWAIFNRRSDRWENSQDPFIQAKDASFAFKNAVHAIFKQFNVNPLISWGCAFPECTGIQGNVEFPSWRFCDGSNFDDFENFLAVLSKKEFGKLKTLSRRSTTMMIDLKIIKSLLNILTPLNQSTESISPEYHELLTKLDEDTRQVYNLMEMMSTNTTILATGPAGTGKTRAAIYECNRLNKASKTFLFWCKSQALSEYVRKWLQIYEVDPKSTVIYGSLIPIGLNLSDFDGLIIDEVQDLAHLDVVQQVIKKFYNEGSSVRLFGDFSFQNFNESQSQFEDWLKAKGISPVRFQLRQNCRNTREVGISIREIADFDDSMITLGAVRGEVVQFKNDITKDDLPYEIRTIVHNWNEMGYPESGITVLTYSPFDEKDYMEWFCSSIGAKSITAVENECNEGKLRISDVVAFKGLESPNIILVVNKLDDDWQKLFYTGVSRAKINCYILFMKDLPHSIKQNILCKMVAK